MAEYYDIAAKWWRDRLENKSSLGNFKVTESDDPKGGDIMCLLAMALGGKADEKPKDLDKFEKVLAGMIKEKTEKISDFSLSVDYGPCAMLADAARKAHLKSPVFPMKTTMHISKEKVTVSLGYHGRTEIIYPEEK